MILEFLGNKTKFNGVVLRHSIVGKTNEGIFSAVQKKIVGATFHTSKGERTLDISLSLIVIDTGRTKIELLAGTNMDDAAGIIKYILKKRYALADVPTVVEKYRNEKGINSLVERRIKLIDEQAEAAVLASELETKSIETEKEEDTIPVMFSNSDVFVGEYVRVRSCRR